MTALESVKIAATAASDKKGEKITVLEVGDLTALAEYFVLVTGTSTTQVRAIAEEVEDRMEKAGRRVFHTEGNEAGGWILLDYGDILVHVFTEKTRDFYSLERLWADARPVEMNLD